MGLQLVRDKDLSLKDVKYFIIDECDKVLDKPGECFHGPIKHQCQQPGVLSALISGYQLDVSVVCPATKAWSACTCAGAIYSE